jgi:hypothetical protein
MASTRVSSTSWWHDLLWGYWNGLTAWIIMLAHACGGWREYPLYNRAGRSNWYDLGFLLGAGTVLGTGNGKPRARRGVARR